MIVAPGITLTIEPGAIVKFCEGTGLYGEDYTSLVYANSVIFSHIADDQTGGDTNLTAQSLAQQMAVIRSTDTSL